MELDTRIVARLHSLLDASTQAPTYGAFRLNNFTDRQELISYLKHIVCVNNAKQKQYQLETNSSDEVGFLTRETVLLAGYVPQMIRLGVTIDDIRTS